MNLSRIITLLIVLSVAIVVAIVLIVLFRNGDEKISTKSDESSVIAADQFNQTKYQHNATKSNGRANIFNEDGECKLWGSENRIDGGVKADIGDLPCIALLEYLLLNQNAYSFDCAGSLINHRYVLTAAQCLVKYENKRLVNIRLGEYDMATNPDCDEEMECQPPAINVGIESIQIHPEYSIKTMANDIGLIRMSMDVPYENYFIKPICIPDETMSTAVGIVSKVSGWGTDGQGKQSTIMRSVWVQIIDPQQCQAIYAPKAILPSQLCAGGERDRNACVEDLGGPLLMRHNKRSYVEGIVSFSSGCARNGTPDVYTKVSHFGVWIRDNLKP